VSVASPFFKLLLILCFLFVISIPRERDSPEYQNVFFARNGRTSVGNGFFCSKG